MADFVAVGSSYSCVMSNTIAWLLLSYAIGTSSYDTVAGFFWNFSFADFADVIVY